MRIVRTLPVIFVAAGLLFSHAPAQASNANLYVYLVRHGQSVANATGFQSGWSPTPLTPLGQRQATAIGKKLKFVDFTAAYSSGSVRSVDTLAAVLASRTSSLTAQVDPSFREWGVGFFDEKPASVAQAAEAKVLKTTTANLWKFTDAQRFDALAKADPSKQTENWLQFKTRILRGIANLKSANPSGQVLVVSHGYVIKHLIKLLTGSYTSLPIKNTTVTVLEYTRGRWILKQGPTLSPKVYGAVLTQ